jgi:hypothetical protein
VVEYSRSKEKNQVVAFGAVKKPFLGKFLSEF